ncbi:DNA-directed RNA polymerase subunit delta [Paenactinomyces guangxiensis]|uniref:DNA-directed RNA polymerase subunit delta n=1 Tax=Paenactinomyces guangxiensis TaxID=1490290 RepID=UPI001E58173B|nr:DNA-directed RNA polymerase subunit delta [Paenactinomyces guangxiensis]
MSDNLATEKIMETAMVDLAYDVLKSKNEPMLYRDIMNEVAKLKGFTEEEVARYIAQLYTEVNIDGRFICVGRSLWGLRHWYPTEQATDSAVAANVKDDYLDDDLEDEIYDEEDDKFNDPDLENLDSLDDDYNDDEESPFEHEMGEDELSDEEDSEEDH